MAEIHFIRNRAPVKPLKVSREEERANIQTEEATAIEASRRKYGPASRASYRAHISAPVDCKSRTERTAFVESSCHHGAISKIANAVAALELRHAAEDVREQHLQRVQLPRN